MAPASSSSAGVACLVLLLLLLLAGASAAHGSFQARRALSDDHGSGIVARWRRLLADAATPANNSLVLAAARTHRSDPFANLTAYSGGWNISDEHYWASVTYTAVPLFLMAVLWFVGFGIVMLVISCCCCCFCRGKNDAYSPGCYLSSLVLLIIFTMATIAGCLILHGGSDLFHGSTIRTVEYVFGQGNLTVDHLRNFADSLAAAKDITINQIFLPADVQQKIDVVEEKLNSSAGVFSTRLQENSRKIKGVLNHMEHELFAVAAVMAGLSILGFLFSVLGLRFLVSLLVIAAWILLTNTIISSGLFLLLHKMGPPSVCGSVVADTCVAMGDWVAHPQAHTALDDILPCVDVATANESLYRSQEVTSQLVALVNNVVVNISNRDFPPGLRPLYFNQSGPLMPVLCNPFNPDMSPRRCAPGEVDFGSAAREWKRFECQTTGPPGSELCATPGRVTPAAYGQMTAATSVSKGLYEFSPFLVQLQDCSFVRETFTSITNYNCPGLEQYSRDVYVGLVVISAGVMLSVVFWMVHTRHRRRRAMRKQL
ncbi:hypothetical protein Zm00014a_023745 [Zea mays]|uniref:Uncharacterized protein n=2 Tax=Zea mays TaxID=4577 RepID=A0A3L6G565_MAIZE|nr:hypothetical protein Zm00014a_023745 [Zea mays]